MQGRLALLLLAAMLTLGGCQRKTTIPPPSPPPPLAITTGADGHAIVRVFYATDREPGSLTPRGVSYLASENLSDALSYGTAAVSIPPGHHMGELEEPSFWRLEFSDNPAEHVVLSKVSTEDQGQFFRELGSAVDNSKDKDAFVFVHGYRVTFDQAVMRTAQIAYDLNFSGVPILYSWPSRGTLGGYGADEDSIRWTSDHLARFLDDVYSRSHAKTIHLIAHSMGNRALLDALKKLADRHSPSHFNELVMAAPDISVSEFRQDIPSISPKVNHLTLYASSNDDALAASKKINHYQRAGDTQGGVTIDPPVETIDASNVDTDLIGHSYFSGPMVISDIYYIFRTGAYASNRARLQERGSGSKTYWIFTPAEHWWIW